MHLGLSCTQEQRPLRPAGGDRCSCIRDMRHTTRAGAHPCPSLLLAGGPTRETQPCLSCSRGMACCRVSGQQACGAGVRFCPLWAALAPGASPAPATRQRLTAASALSHAVQRPVRRPLHAPPPPPSRPTPTLPAGACCSTCPLMLTSLAGCGLAARAWSRRLPQQSGPQPPPTGALPWQSIRAPVAVVALACCRAAGPGALSPTRDSGCIKHGARVSWQLTCTHPSSPS
jgi:hypothetical protein